MIRKALICLAVLALPAQAQEVVSGTGAVLRALDKVSGDTVDIEIALGQTRKMGRIQVVLSDCRYPSGNPAGNAFAALEISEVGREGSLFSGWMIASAPALSALEHPRYDIWVIRCITS